MANPPPPFATAIINPQYCVPHAVDLIMKKERTFGDNFTVTDINDNVVFTVNGPLVTIVTPRGHRFLRDAYGNPIVHLRRSLFANGWKAFRGESIEQMDLIFTREQPSLFQLRTKLKVFLANNTTEVCDFKLVKASFFERSWVVFVGESDTVVAQIKHKLGNIVSREKFMITVSPNIDYAFIVALTVTLEDYLKRRRRTTTTMRTT